MKEKGLFPYQREGVDLIVNKFRHVLLADPPGAGKSAQAIVAAKELNAKSILVICPASLRLNWAREFEMWAPGQWRVYAYLSSRDFTYKWEWARKDPGVTIVSYDLATARAEELVFPEWDLLIWDEAHFLKSWKSNRTRKCVRVIRPGVKKLIAITGTPIPNGRAIEAHPVFASLSPGEFGHFKTFRDKYCVRQQTPWGTQYTKSKNLKELGQLARQHFMIRRSKEEVLGQLPPLVRQEVPLEVDLEDAYYELLKKCEDIEATAEMVVEGKLLIPGPIASIRRLLGAAKVGPALDFIKDLLEETGRAVVFAHHKEVVRALMSSFDAQGITCVTLLGDTSPTNRQKAVDYFQAGHAQVFLGSLLAASTGITLTRASAVVMVEYDWVPSNNEQAEGRCYRVTQNDITRVFYLFVPNSLDESVMEMVMRKQKDIGKVMGEEPRPDEPEVATAPLT